MKRALFALAVALAACTPPAEKADDTPETPAASAVDPAIAAVVEAAMPGVTIVSGAADGAGEYEVSGALNGYGMYVLQAQLTEFAPCRAFAINGHAAVGNYALWTGF